MTFKTEFWPNDHVQGCTTRRIIVAQRNDPNSDATTNSRKLSELRKLAHAVNYVVFGTFVQSRHPERKYQIGSGKVDELKELVYQNLPKWEHSRIIIPMSEEGLSMASWLHEEGIVHSIDYGESIVMDMGTRGG